MAVGADVEVLEAVAIGGEDLGYGSFDRRGWRDVGGDWLDGNNGFLQGWRCIQGNCESEGYLRNKKERDGSYYGPIHGSMVFVKMISNDRVVAEESKR